MVKVCRNPVHAFYACACLARTRDYRRDRYGQRTCPRLGQYGLDSDFFAFGFIDEHGGLVRQKNVLSVIMQTLFIVGVVSVLWIAFGYSWAFDTSFAESGNPLACVMGGFDKAFLHGITLNTLTTGNIPEILFAMFQCMFAIITPALILGAFAERIKFSGYIVFIVLWTILAYFPMVSPWHTGYGAEDSFRKWEPSTLPEEPWCISMPEYPR